MCMERGLQKLSSVFFSFFRFATFDRVVEVLALGASLFGGVGSIPPECILFILFFLNFLVCLLEF